MRLGRIAGLWLAVVGGGVTLLYLLLAGDLFGTIFFIAFFGLAAFFVLRAASQAQVEPSELRGDGLPFYVVGMILLLASGALFGIFVGLGGVLLLVATLPPALMSLAAGLQVGRQHRGRLSD